MKELIPRHLQEGKITEAPSEYSRAYFPTKEDIRCMARRAIMQQKIPTQIQGSQKQVDKQRSAFHQIYPLPVINVFFSWKLLSNVYNMIFLAHREAKPVAEHANRTGTKNGR